MNRCLFAFVFIRIMEKKEINYEKRALLGGLIINAFSALVGIGFFFWSKSQAIFLDAFISFILFASTLISLFVSNSVRKEADSSYPLGRWAIENIFLIFRSILMLFIIVFSLINSISTIVSVATNSAFDQLNVSYLNMSIYAGLMVGSCFLISIIYAYCNKKIDGGSEIIKLEIKASIYDGLVTLFATSSLLLFTFVDFLNPLKDYIDSIVTIILSLIYAISPIREIIYQIKVLVDKRRDVDEEQEILKKLVSSFPEFKYYDVYYSYSDHEGAIYVCLYPKVVMKSEELHRRFIDIEEYLYKEYDDPKVILVLSKTKLHKL